MTTISTVNLHNITTGGALNVETQLAKVQIQESSGLVAQDFGTLGGSATSEMLNLQDNISQAQTWASEAQTVGGRTQSMYSILGNMVATVTSLQGQISQALASPNTASLLSAAQNLQKNLVSQMNTQYAGRYLFAGSAIGTIPVSLTGYDSASGKAATSIPDNSYYQGDSNILSVQVSSQQTLSYGVTANNPAFEESLRACQSVAQAAAATQASGQSLSGSWTYTGGSPDTMTINGVSVAVSSGDSLTTIANSINTAAGTAGSSVTAKVVTDTATGNQTLQVSSGNTTDLTFGGTAATLTALGLSNTTYSASLKTALNSAMTLANQGVTDLSNLQASVAAVSSQLSAAQQQQTTYVTFLQNSLSNVKDADTAQVAAQVQSLQTQLQASYMAVASVSKINLAQYL